MAEPRPPPTAPADPGAPVPSPDAPQTAPERQRLRLTAFAGTAASILWLVAYFLPWIVVAPAQRDRVKAVFEPEIQELERRSPEDGERYRILLQEVVEHGALTGLDLFHYARSAYSLNRHLQGVAPREHIEERPWVLQRAFFAVGIVLAVLPVVSLLLALRLLAQGFRRVGTPTLCALVVIGCTGGALALAWLRFADSLSTDMLRGTGLRIGLVAGIVQAAAGFFGVNARNWWRVYSTSLLLLAGAGAVAALYVVRGLQP